MERERVICFLLEGVVVSFWGDGVHASVSALDANTHTHTSYLVWIVGTRGLFRGLRLTSFLFLALTGCVLFILPFSLLSSLHLFFYFCSVLLEGGRDVPGAGTTTPVSHA